ncbi:MAG: SEC-C metal-binding domain-containing protein [Tepidisphaerales bacterium]
MQPERVKFKSHPRPFRVITRECRTLGCDCHDVNFTFKEAASAESVEVPLRFEIRVDAGTWQEIDAPERPPNIAGFVAEFLRDYPAEERAAFARNLKRKQKALRRMLEYRMDPVKIRRGILIAFTELVSEYGSITAGGSMCTYDFDVDGERFQVEDQYCPNPDCDCKEAHLIFFRVESGEKIVVREHFAARLLFDGTMEIADCVHCTRDQAGRIAAAWNEEYDKEIKTLKWRYDKVKEFGRRCLDAAPARIEPPRLEPVKPVVAGRKVGRNDPCPCGSGKKYKKCCGR